MGNSTRGKIRTLKFKEEVFGADVHVMIGGSYDKALARITSVYGTTMELDGVDDQDEGFCSERINTNTFNGWVIWLHSTKDPSYIVHEVVHLVNYLLTYHGIDVKDDELRAFYEAYWFKRIYDKR